MSSTLSTPTEVPLSKAPNPQLFPGRCSINGCPLLRVYVCGVCVRVCTAVCVCARTLDGKCRALIPSMGHHTWPRHFHLLNKLLVSVGFPRVGVVSAPPVDTPPAFESREYCLFCQDFDTFTFTCQFFLAFKFGWVVNKKKFCGVTNSEHTFNIDFTRTLTLMKHYRPRQILLVHLWKYEWRFEK